jgi:hypothetical protein
MFKRLFSHRYKLTDEDREKGYAAVHRGNDGRFTSTRVEAARAKHMARLRAKRKIEEMTEVLELQLMMNLIQTMVRFPQMQEPLASWDAKPLSAAPPIYY